MTQYAKITRGREELTRVLAENPSPEPPIPDLLALARHPERFRDRVATRLLLESTARYLQGIESIPQTTYSMYRDYQRTGERRTHHDPYIEKRSRMASMAIRVLLGEDHYLDCLQDYVWNVCEETTWVDPPHEPLEIDLGAAWTGFTLAEISIGLGHKLVAEVVQRIREEIERRILSPYLARFDQHWWYQRTNNWNGVCNSAVGAAFLLLEPDVARQAQALELVLAGLETFINLAFEPDGSCAEGVHYWQYGLANFIAFCEMLRVRTRGAIDILALERMKDIARYPLQVMLSPGHYANFSDSDEEPMIDTGLVVRLAERTGVGELLGILAAPAPLAMGLHRFHSGSEAVRFHRMWRGMLWWDGVRPASVVITDVINGDRDLARLVATTPSGVPVVLVAKAGHNAVSHNHNDVGSFILHIDGQTYLCDPGRGLYHGRYSGAHRYDNVFLSSIGHSVPRIAGQTQKEGLEYRGEITRYDAAGPQKHVVIAIERAYPVPRLRQAMRALVLDAASGQMVLEDHFRFSDQGGPVEEALMTWLEVEVEGKVARLRGEKHVLQLEIEAPDGATFALQVLKEQTEANARPVPLKRLSFQVAPGCDTAARVRARVLDRGRASCALPAGRKKGA